MAKVVDPLHWNTPIVDSEGCPTKEFMAKWRQQHFINTGVPTELSDLADVDADNPVDDASLVWDGVAQQWRPRVIHVPAVTSDLNDVSTTGPADGQILVWDDATQQYQPQDTSTSLDSLSDVDLSTPPTAGQVLGYNAMTNKWSAVDQSGGGGGGGSSRSIANILDSGASSSGYAAKGSVLTPISDVWIYAVGGVVYPVVGGTYIMQLCEMSGGTVVSVLATTQTVTATTAGRQPLMIQLATKVKLTSGTTYGVFHIRTDASASTPSGAAGGNTPFQGIGDMSGTHYFRAESVLLSANDTVDVGSSAGYGLAVEFSLA